MARFVIVGTRQSNGSCCYISRKGNTTYNAENAAVIRQLAEAKKEVDYWRLNTRGYIWRIEQLPRGPVASAILRAVPVESELIAT